MKPSSPAYRQAAADGRLQRQAALAKQALAVCRLCPRDCGARRLAGETGFCRCGAAAVVAGYGPHFGEEQPLVGRHGSGTIFFAHCNLRCTFCQNYEISHLGHGDPATADQLAAIMLALQAMGCANINLVTPSHVVPQILEALCLAAADGLRLPLVYTTRAPTTGWKPSGCWTGWWTSTCRTSSSGMPPWPPKPARRPTTAE